MRDTDLADRPVVVFPNNDGCIVVRSAAAKALGIPVGKPTVLSGRGPDQAARRRGFFCELRLLRRPVGPGDGSPGAVHP